MEYTVQNSGDTKKCDTELECGEEICCYQDPISATRQKAKSIRTQSDIRSDISLGVNPQLSTAICTQVQSTYVPTYVVGHVLGTYGVSTFSTCSAYTISLRANLCCTPRGPET